MRKIAWLRTGLAGFEILSALAVVMFDVGATAATLAVLVMLTWLSVLCERREVVFGSELKWSKLQGLAFFLVPVMLINYVLSEPAPSWYPTAHSAWILLPFIAFGLASLLRGWFEPIG